MKNDRYMILAFRSKSQSAKFAKDVHKLDSSVIVDITADKLFASVQFDYANPSRKMLEAMARAYDSTCLMQVRPKRSRKAAVDHKYYLLETKTVYVGDLCKTVIGEIKGGCKACRAGAVQVGPLRIVLSIATRLSRSHVLDAWYGLIVSRDVAIAIANASGSWNCLRQCVSKSTGDEVEAWQLMPDATVQRNVIASKGIEQSVKCKTCKRSGFAKSDNKALCYAVAKKKLDHCGMPSLLNTWECWYLPMYDGQGGAEIVVPSLPMVLVRSDVAKMLLDTCARSVKLTPVCVV